MAGFSVQEFTELLPSPIGSWMVGYVAMQNSPRADLDGDKDIHNLKGRGYRGEEIAGNDGTCVIVKERRPTLAGRLPRHGTRASSW